MAHSETLQALAQVHRDQLAHERSRTTRIGHRSDEDKAIHARIMRVQRELWIDAGGKASDFVLADLLAEFEGKKPPAEPGMIEPSKKRSKNDRTA